MKTLITACLASCLFIACDRPDDTDELTEIADELVATFPCQGGDGVVGVVGLRGTGEPDGRGFTVFWSCPSSGQLAFRMAVSGVDAITMAHIHQSSATSCEQTGPVVVNFDVANADTAQVGNRTFFRNQVDVDAAVLAQIAENPAGFYINVHSEAAPAGAVCGELQ